MANISENRSGSGHPHPAGYSPKADLPDDAPLSSYEAMVEDGDAAGATRTDSDDPAETASGEAGDTMSEEDAEPDAETERFYAESETNLGVSLNGTENRELLEAIQGWIGTRYRFGGCSKGSGVDCSCLVKTIYGNVYGVELARSSAAMSDEVAETVDREDLREGDLLFFNTRRGRRISHVAIYLKDGYFVHASRRYGVVIGNMDQDYFRRRFVKAGRVLVDDKALQVADKRRR